MAFARTRIAAILGPTNTGKTHLAIERMAAHSSGMIGLPLRLLAREVYDRLVAMKGEREVALITGEQRIVPKGARWFACTAESMPTTHDTAFVAIDEAQLGGAPERGHVFTDRMLNARGRDETLILGSATLAPMVRALVPEAEIVTRPRFSTLRYAGARKLSRLPPRSAIVAFSAEEVYAIAEMLRRQRGGAAVVMGGLSPRTRNAQVAMFQAGEVDYLVATDAIGMGLNLDLDHVAFAGLAKYDGQRRRRLTLAEMAQIAGRAGRHHRDGSFGVLGAEAAGIAFSAEEIERIEEHRFEPLESLYWRNGSPDFASVAALIASLEQRPAHPALRPAPEAEDLAVLKRLTDDPDAAAQVAGADAVARLWAVCSIPDYRKLGVEPHARFVAGLWRHLANGYLPVERFAAEIARLDTLDGDLATLSARLAAIRSWAYIAERPDWLEAPAHWAERTRAIEERLSDTLHERLRQRFVDTRTHILVKLAKSDVKAMPVTLEGDTVMVAGEALGELHGFRFVADRGARGAERRMLMAAAETRLGALMARRAAELAGDDDAAFALLPGGADGAPAIAWRGAAVATLAAGQTLLTPRVVADRSIDRLPPAAAAAVRARIGKWLTGRIADVLAPLIAVEAAAKRPDTPALLRGVLAHYGDAGGVLSRAGAVAAALDRLNPDERQMLRAMGITPGSFDLYDARLLKPRAAALRLMLAAVRDGRPPAVRAVTGAATIDAAACMAGYRVFGSRAVRVDLAERLVRALHRARRGDGDLSAATALAVSLGLDAAAQAALFRKAGFRMLPGGRVGWRAPDQDRKRGQRGVTATAAATPRPGNAFAALAEMIAAGD